MRNYDIPSSSGVSQYPIEAGEIVFIAGPNGVGKSSLLHHVARSSGSAPDVEIFSGHRQIHFQNDDIDQISLSIEQLQQQMYNFESTSNRYRSNWGEQHLKSVIRRILNLHTQQNENIIDSSIKAGHFTINIKDSLSRIIHTINRIFDQSEISIRIVLENGVLRACRDTGASYGIDRLSDGERAALLLVGGILVRPKSSVIAIDEPEKHLNPQISGRLIAAAYRSRRDLCYFIASHELRLIEELQPKTIVYVSDSRFTMSGDMERAVYTVSVLSNSKDIPENIKIKILGSRKPLLFVEGESSSYDRQFFQYLYADRTVVPGGGWESVTSAVRSLNSSKKYHWVHPAGLIDRDGRDINEVGRLSQDRIFTLPTPTIENLFFHPLVVRVMVHRFHGIYGGKTPSERFHSAAAKSIDSIRQHSDSIVARKVTWKANRLLSERKLSVKDVIKGKKFIDGIQLEPLIFEAREELSRSLSSHRPFRACFVEPIKNTAIPNAIAVDIGFDNFNKYCEAVLWAMEADLEAGKRLIRALRAILPNIK